MACKPLLALAIFVGDRFGWFETSVKHFTKVARASVLCFPFSSAVLEPQIGHDSDMRKQRRRGGAEKCAQNGPK